MTMSTEQASPMSKIHSTQWSFWAGTSSQVSKNGDEKNVAY